MRNSVIKYSANERDDIDYLFELLEENEPAPGTAFNLRPEMFLEELPSNVVRLEKRRLRLKAGFNPTSLIAAAVTIAFSTVIALMLLLGTPSTPAETAYEVGQSPTPVITVTGEEIVRRYSLSGLVFDGVYLPTKQEFVADSNKAHSPISNSTYGFWQW